MTVAQFDVVVLGSGFGGSLLSTILAKSGQSVALVDSAKHPRFAIGESSTPLANVTLAELAKTYDLPEVSPLTKYGTWKDRYPEIGCGIKRGFSYFGHTPGATFCEEHQLLVAASRTNAAADTHWLRSDVDHFFFELARKYGVSTFEDAKIKIEANDSLLVRSRHESNSTSDNTVWRIGGTYDGKPLSLETPFVVDATGAAGVVLKTLGIEDQTCRLKTNSSAVFAHFNNVPCVSDVLQKLDADCTRHPYDCDAAAVHHVLDNGWMWQLRFDDNSVSAGLLFDQRADPGKATLADPEHAWKVQVERFPFLKTQFASGTVPRPHSGLHTSRRLQRLWSAAAGNGWAALPSTAGFIDPLHSTGIAHTLFGVRRLASILTSASVAERGCLLADYSETVVDELWLIDELVEGCYAALPSFRLWSDWCMLYFAAVTSMEQSASSTADCSFLRADDVAFRRIVSDARLELQKAIDAGSSATDCTRFEERMRTQVEPWNRVGLLDDACRGMYADTAL